MKIFSFDFTIYHRDVSVPPCKTPLFSWGIEKVRWLLPLKFEEESQKASSNNSWLKVKLVILSGSSDAKIGFKEQSIERN